jgi:hypothetical protein
MSTCPACSQEVAKSTPVCSACGAFLGSGRDLLHLACFLAATFGLLALVLGSYIIEPNAVLGKVLQIVKDKDSSGLKIMREAADAGEISIAGQDLGWNVERFGDVFLVMFTWFNPKEETIRHYSVWWVYDATADKIGKVQKVEEFTDGYLLRGGLKSLFPSGVPVDPRFAELRPSPSS